MRKLPKLECYSKPTIIGKGEDAKILWPGEKIPKDLRGKEIEYPDEEMGLDGMDRETYTNIIIGICNEAYMYVTITKWLFILNVAIFAGRILLRVLL